MSNLREVFQKYAAVVFFDTETTGLEADSCQIIELAAIRIEQTERGTLRMASSADLFIKLPAGQRIPEKIVELTKIRIRRVRSLIIVQEMNKRIIIDSCSVTTELDRIIKKVVLLIRFAGELLQFLGIVLVAAFLTDLGNTHDTKFKRAAFDIIPDQGLSQAEKIKIYVVRICRSVILIRRRTCKKIIVIDREIAPIILYRVKTNRVIGEGIRPFYNVYQIQLRVNLERMPNILNCQAVIMEHRIINKVIAENSLSHGLFVKPTTKILHVLPCRRQIENLTLIHCPFNMLFKTDPWKIDISFLMLLQKLKSFIPKMSIERKNHIRNGRGLF